MNFKDVFSLLKGAATEWSEDKVSRLAAALAYYAVFSLPAILLITLVIVGNVFGPDYSQEQLVSRINDVVPNQAAETMANMIKNVDREEGGLLATIAGIAMLLFAASGLFAQLQDSMNKVWEVAPDPEKGVMDTIKDRGMAALLVLGVGLLFILAFLVNTLLAGFEPLVEALPGSPVIQQIITFLVSTGLLTVAFAALFKIMPDVTINWSDVWVGAGITAFLWMIGQIVIAFYLGRSAMASTYGAAGGLAVLLFWMYYSANLLLFGAELTQVYANEYGSQIQAQENAINLRRQVMRQQARPGQEPAKPGRAGQAAGNRSRKREAGRPPRKPKPGRATGRPQPAAQSNAELPAQRHYVERKQLERKRWSPRDYVVGLLAIAVGLRERRRKRD